MAFHRIVIGYICFASFWGGVTAQELAPSSHYHFDPQGFICTLESSDFYKKIEQHRINALRLLQEVVEHYSFIADEAQTNEVAHELKVGIDDLYAVLRASNVVNITSYDILALKAEISAHNQKIRMRRSSYIQAGISPRFVSRILILNARMLQILDEKSFKKGFIPERIAQWHSISLQEKVEVCCASVVALVSIAWGMSWVLNKEEQV